MKRTDQSCRSIKEKIWSRLRDERGESLTETLVSVLIIALGLTLLASMVTAAGKLIRKSQSYYQESTAVRNAIEGQDGTHTGDGTDLSVTVTPVQGSLSFAGNGEVLTDDATLGGTPSFTCRMTGAIDHAILLQQLSIQNAANSSVAALDGKAFTYTDTGTAAAGSAQTGK